MLIFAAKGTPDAAALALTFLQDQNREFVTSEYVRLEVLPKAIFHGNVAEVEFYNGFFQQLNIRTVQTSIALLELAAQEAFRTGISGLDAIHIACAVFGGAEELVTSEKTTKPIHRTRLVRVISIFPAQVALPPPECGTGP